MMLRFIALVMLVCWSGVQADRRAVWGSVATPTTFSSTGEQALFGSRCGAEDCIFGSSASLFRVPPEADEDDQEQQQQQVVDKEVTQLDKVVTTKPAFVVSSSQQQGGATFRP